MPQDQIAYYLVKTRIGGLITSRAEHSVVVVAVIVECPYCPSGSSDRNPGASSSRGRRHLSAVQSPSSASELLSSSSRSVSPAPPAIPQPHLLSLLSRSAPFDLHLILLLFQLSSSFFIIAAVTSVGA